MKINCRLNSFVKKRDGVQNAFVKNFLTRSGQSVLLRDFLRKIDTTNSISRKASSGWPRTARTEQDIERVAELICSQEDNPGPASPRDIENFDRNIPHFCATNR